MKHPAVRGASPAGQRAARAAAGHRPDGVELTERITGAWPAVGVEPQVWDWHGERPSSRADRIFCDYESALAPEVADLDPNVDRAAGAALNDAIAAIVTLEADPNAQLAAVGGALLRSESVGSSKIEHLDIDARDLSIAAIGQAKERSVAAQVWANVGAMNAAIAAASADPLDVSAIHSVHRALMRKDPHEAARAGRPRDMQNWIGGSDVCPRDALFVPPAPTRVDGLMRDLAAWCNRDDLPALEQAAIAHAQFETIHPYTDGNGRTGRALIHTVLRRRGLTPHVIVPTSSALLADIDGYFDALGNYRAGDLSSYLTTFAIATTRAATEARDLGAEIHAIANEWADTVQPRSGSTAQRLLDGLLQQPVITAAENAAVGMSDTATIYRTLDRLVELGIIVELTEHRRNRIWVATQITSALDDFAQRIGRRRPPP